LFEAAHDPSIVTTLRAAARVALGEFVRLIATLRDHASEAAVDELLREVVESIRYGDYLRAEGPESAERLDNVRELITGAAETVADDLGEVGLRPLDHFLQRSSLVADSDALGADADAVTLMTLHNAKGLEFPVVFITGLEDGLFPLAKAYDDPPLLEEERRLFYVGITRARKKLYLSHAEERRRNGELLGARQSSFLDGIPPAMLEKRSTIKVRSSGRSFMRATGGGESNGYGGGRGGFGRGGGGFERRSRLEMDLDEVTPRASAAARRPGVPVGFSGGGGVEYESQDAPNYVIGARVKHRKFGSGTIAELAGAGRDAKVKVDFDDEAVGRKTLVIAQANLERADD
jgi:DNA helicase-2/ATP-dependent DNA helicase PcrA